MTDDCLITAFDRLEQAIIRLEARLPECLKERDVPGDPDLPARHARLTERHEALRLRTTSAVERLTLLLEPSRGE